MSSHTCKPGHPGILADDCERCEQLADSPLLLELDRAKTEALWDRMIEVERHHIGGYETANEAVAGRKLYHLAIWLQRHLGFDPWVEFASLAEELHFKKEGD